MTGALLQYGMPLPELNFNKNCKHCVRGEGKAIPGCIQNGNLSKLKLVVISDYPSYYEELNDHNFYDNEGDRAEKRKTGKRLHVGWPNAGNYIRRKLESFDLDTYQEVYFTNAIKCKNNSDKTIVPNQTKEVKKCAQLWLIPELNIIEQINPTVPILLAGKYAFTAFREYIPGSPFHKKLKLKEARRKEFKYKYHPVFVTVNPAAAATSIPKLEFIEVTTKGDLKSVRELPTNIGSPDWLYSKDLELLRQCLLTSPSLN